MRRLYVPLNPAEFTQLQDIATAERRPVQYQAAIIIAERLARTTAEVPNQQAIEPRNAERPPEATR